MHISIQRMTRLVATASLALLLAIAALVLTGCGEQEQAGDTSSAVESSVTTDATAAVDESSAAAEAATGEQAPQEDAAVGADDADDTDAEQDAAAETRAAGDKEAAEGLIGTSVTRDELEAAVGSGEKFEMSAAGCERGVYAGYFYYDGFSIFTRTYDQGKTFSVVAVNE